MNRGKRLHGKEGLVFLMYKKQKWAWILYIQICLYVYNKDEYIDSSCCFVGFENGDKENERITKE